MSISQNRLEEFSSDQFFCPHCHAALPLCATFCSSCGERLKRRKQTYYIDEQDINNRYRITRLIRRRPYVNLYFAADNRAGHSRMVAIREIDISHLRKEARAEVINQIQQEYDHLRRWPVPHTLASVDLRLFQGRIFLVSQLPTQAQAQTTSSLKGLQRLYTLQDFLQSGQGLPNEQRVLEWMHALCQAVERLHRRHIIFGDLDPYTI